MFAWLASLLLIGAAPADEAAGLRGDALALETLIDAKYAYRERLAGSRYRFTPKLRAEAQAVASRRDLVRFAERALALLADHHAITGASLEDSWAIFPSFGDLWIERLAGDFIVEQVRRGGPAERAGVRAGDRLVAIDGVPTAAAVAAYWEDLGAEGGGERDGHAARVLAAGRRDRPRVLTIRRAGGRPTTLNLPSLYQQQRAERPPLTGLQEAGTLVIRIHDSLGDSATITAFDAAMAAAKAGQPILIDLTDTPSGGNTIVARAMLGWFVTRPAFYQVHNLPAELRETGIARQWAEQVLPRPGKAHRGPVTVRVGRWTGSMGEGIAIGFAAFGHPVIGSRMAGLLGAIHDHRLQRSDLVVKLPTERLYAVDGTPREAFVPAVPAGTLSPRQGFDPIGDSPWRASISSSGTPIG